jgi:hypothetical protein
MFDRRKIDSSRFLKVDCYKNSANDPTLTFQPRSAPQAAPEGRKERQVLNKLLFQELTRKPPTSRVLPPILSISSASSSAFHLRPLNSGRQCLQSDSRPRKLDHGETVSERMGNLCTERKGTTRNSDFAKDEDGVTTPTFVKGEEIKWEDLFGKAKKEKRESNGSGIGSSISTDFPGLSPRSGKEKAFFQSYLPQVGMKVMSERKAEQKGRREHPKIRVSKSGLPKDVFIIKNNKY